MLDRLLNPHALKSKSKKVQPVKLHLQELITVHANIKVIFLFLNTTNLDQDVTRSGR